MAPEATAHAPNVARPRALRAVRVLGVTALVGTLALIVLRFAVGWFFPVASGSMEPTVMTDEVVFLRYDDGVPDRYSIIAFTAVGGGASVKRAAGLPNERVLIEPTGDLRIDGKLIPEAPWRPPLVTMFDSHLQSIGEHWRRGGSVIDPWSLADGCAPGRDEVWQMDGSAVGRAKDLGLLGLHYQIDDGRLLPNGERELGKHTVHDVAVSFEVFFAEPGGLMRVQVTEQADVFEATVPVYAGEENPRINVFRRRPSTEKPDYLAIGTAHVSIGRWIPVRFSNIDNRVTFAFGDSEPVVVDYERNLPHPMAIDRAPISPGERVRLGGSGAVLRVRNIVVERDFHIVPRGTYGIEHELLLGPDEVFVLGDASGVSRDSREAGPVDLDRVFGRAEAVVWPLRSARTLR